MTIEFLLIHNDPPCAKCRKTLAVINELAAAAPAGDVAVRSITVNAPEAQAYGVVLAPMLILNGKIVCAGMAPVKAGLEKLLAAERAADGA